MAIRRSRRTWRERPVLDVLAIVDAEAARLQSALHVHGVLVSAAGAGAGRPGAFSRRFCPVVYAFTRGLPAALEQDSMSSRTSRERHGAGNPTMASPGIRLEFPCTPPPTPSFTIGLLRKGPTPGGGGGGGSSPAPSALLSSCRPIGLRARPNRRLHSTRACMPPQMASPFWTAAPQSPVSPTSSTRWSRTQSRTAARRLYSVPTRRCRGHGRRRGDPADPRAA